MKINTNKNVEIVMHFGEMRIYVDGELVDETKVQNNAAYALGAMVGTLRKEGVILD
jgi:hypothetical protein